MAATFYKLGYSTVDTPDQTWLNNNGAKLATVRPPVMTVAQYSRTENAVIYSAMFYNTNDKPQIISCSKTQNAVSLGRSIGAYPGQNNTTVTSNGYSNFYYGTTGNAEYTPIVDTFESLEAALAYADILLNTPSVDVANLSGIFVGSTEIQKVLLNGATIYQKAAAGFQVTIQQNALSAPSGASDVLIYDGQSSESGTLVGTIAYDDFLQHTYTITSGFIAICGIVLDSPGTASGGVAYVGETPSGEDGYYYAVTGDGSITDFAFICLTGDALVTMADGTQKRLDEIEIGDSVLSLDWETKDLIARKVIFTDKDENKAFTEFDRWIFADGTEIKTVHRHEFYNVEKGGMAYMDTWEIGDHAYRIDGSKVALVGHENVKETVKHYKITLEGDTNYFVHGLLNGDRNCPKEKL